jgi:hypothetical protein
MHKNSGYFRQKSDHTSANGIGHEVSVLIVNTNQFQFCRPASKEIDRWRCKSNTGGSSGPLMSQTNCARLTSTIFLFAEKLFQIEVEFVNVRMIGRQKLVLFEMPTFDAIVRSRLISQRGSMN